MPDCFKWAPKMNYYSANEMNDKMYNRNYKYSYTNDASRKFKKKKKL